ncbi:Kelch domain-containing protein 2 [Fasciola gigantica]|uniref:Kelch domain-containing protein 2 n=1 Tax=Fasciola gigantica TaxID=46835 RepID=A0A504YS45_FASGI|nr:Kelch domain-containing protein 2 [Fasciola gigantica]
MFIGIMFWYSLWIYFISSQRFLFDAKYDPSFWKTRFKISKPVAFWSLQIHMNENVDARWWTGMNDSAHPLGRSAHATVTHGRYIYVINGYTSTEGGTCLYERAGLTRYDPLTGSTCFLPVHWDYESARRRGFSLPLLNTSGMTVAVQPETKREPAYIYAFAGFSLLESFHTNVLVRFRLPRSNHAVLPVVQSDPHAMCCYAEVVSGHGILSFMLSLPLHTRGTEAFCLTALRAVQRRWNRYPGWRANHVTARSHCEPSPRDKLCMEYWRGRLYAFGGYGPRFSPHPHWPSRWIRWPFLFDSGNTHEWFPCELDRGWNNQLLIFNVRQRSWSLISRSEMSGGNAPSARAAHQSALDDSRGWLLIFGGRGPPVSFNTNPWNRREFFPSELYGSGRLNDLYCLNLTLLEWTRILTPLDRPNVDLEPREPFPWPSGRSWMGLGLASLARDHTHSPQSCLFTSCIFPEKNGRTLCHLCVVGGFSNSNQVLSDAWLIRVNRCPLHGLEAHSVATSDARTSTTEPFIPAFKAHRPLVTLLDGFSCNAPDVHAKLDSLLAVHRNGSSHSIIESDRYTLLPSDPFVQEDMKYHLEIYTKGTFNPKQITHKSANQLKPNKPFYQIAKLHTDLILFLLTQLMLYQPCVATDEVRLPESDRAHLAGELDRDCARLLDTLRPSIQITSFLIRILVKFMLPWESLGMLLRETDAWLPRSAQTKLLDEISINHETRSSSTFHLVLSDPDTLDDFALLLPLDKIQIPAPYNANSSNANDQLSYHIRHAILSMFLWSAKSPLGRTVRDFSQPVPVTQPETSEPLFPVARFWHSVTYHPLDGLFYVLGGATAEAIERPVECYGLLEPRPLFEICLKRAATLVLRACLLHPSTLTRPSVPPHICLSSTEPLCSLCRHLDSNLTDTVQGRLVQWLM